MSGAALALGGWMAAALAAAAAGLVARLLHAQREATVRAAHELRGPLTAIGLGLELSRRRGQAAGEESWQGLELELARARLALEDLGAGGSGPGRLDRLERIGVERLIADSVAAARGLAAAAGVALRGQWSGPAAFVWGDRVRLAQALGNLIANAIEHGGGEVDICGRASGGLARIEVRDSGPGLPASLAELSDRARGGRGRRGRGLAIAGQIVRRHGGRLAGAPAARGARLVLELPAAVSGAGRPDA